jgi:hypothetical protein
MTILDKPRIQLLLFLLLFVVINLLQSNFTFLLEDEAYYWMWSENLAWGYFDHPPMVAVYAWMGGLLFDGELGVRVIGVFSFTLLLLVLWKTLRLRYQAKDVVLFMALVVAMALLQVYGFILTPDTPLMLFIGIFFLAYYRFLQKNSWQNILFLGFTMAGMLYSKYHGVLVIFFVLLSNLSLLRNRGFWLASLFGFALFIPHLVWQYENDFPSFVYHLKERSKKPYRISNTLNHLINIIAIVGITFPIVYKAFFRGSAQEVFDRGCKFVVYGFMVFFFLSSFSSQTQAQWLAAMLIPLLLVTYGYFTSQRKAHSWLLKLSGIQFLILLAARVIFAAPGLSPMVLEPHVKEQWVDQLKELSENKPVVFLNMYGGASLYQFYTGIDTHVYSIVNGRKTQFDLWPTEDMVQGADVFAAGKKASHGSKVIDAPDITLYGKAIENYRTFEKVSCTLLPDELSWNAGARRKIRFVIKNKYAKNITFENLEFIGVFQGYKNKVLENVPIQVEGVEELGAGQEMELEGMMIVPKLESTEHLTVRVALSFYGFPGGFQGNKQKVRID